MERRSNTRQVRRRREPVRPVARGDPGCATPARNQAVYSLLARCTVLKGQPHVETPRVTFMDRRGESTAIIENRTRRLAKRAPTWKLADGAELIVTVPAARAADHWNAG